MLFPDCRGPTTIVTGVSRWDALTWASRARLIMDQIYHTMGDIYPLRGEYVPLSLFDQPALDKELAELDGVGRGALAEVV